MSKSYRVVWSKSQGAFVVASELAKSNGKGRSGRSVLVRGAEASSFGYDGPVSGRGGKASRAGGAPKPLALALVMACLYLVDSPAAWAVCTTSGSTVTCSGAANLLAPSFSSAANNLTVNVNTGASAGVLLGLL